MKDYFKEAEFVLDDLKFDYLGGRYRGRGIMTWKPEQGFHIEAPLNLQDMPKLKEVHFGKVRIIRKSDTSSIRMFPREIYNWAIAPAVPLVERDDVISQKRLSINLSRVIFSKYYSTDVTGSSLNGTVFYETKNVKFLFDQVNHEKKTKIQDCDISKSSTTNWNGIYYEGEKGQTIIGHLLDDKYLKVTWSLPKEQFKKAYSWRLPEAIQYSLSILLGQKLSLLKREVRCGNQERIEIRRNHSINSLDLLSLFDNHSTLNKEYFVRLTDLIARNEWGSDVCCNIFRQLREASRQENWQVTELLVATILEAALRNIDGQPFHAKKRESNKWQVEHSLKKFINNYLSEDWHDIYSRVIIAHHYLRDRNAHPDWLFTKGGSLSEEEREKSLDSMIFLSRFYGYMILALAGFRNLKPDFPRPHSEWGAAIIITPAH
jgi:hypothetical protein